MSEPRPVETLLSELQELCACEVEDDPRHQCIYCDAREQIKAQQRTIQLIQRYVPRQGSCVTSTGEQSK